MVDNVWTTSEGSLSKNWVQILMQVVGAGSCLLFSTRLKIISGCADIWVLFDPSTGSELTQNVFDAHWDICPTTQSTMKVLGTISSSSYQCSTACAAE